MLRLQNANIERFRKTVTRPEKKAAGNMQGNKPGNNRKGNRLGNKSDGDPAESPAKIVEKMIAENGVDMTIDEAREMKENFWRCLPGLSTRSNPGRYSL
ncbi:hypothetical protein [Yersinia ruckeri]|uniref:hypothetical protein n=1 Tax=Yersinia ruckeri TaxID=29486 RepID=UPI000DC736AD|nr:hypothetical protein [Yersinia ruckeri]ARZ01756.1 hypothetical protein QMA0440_02434 [Yersinia ruckeri]